MEWKRPYRKRILFSTENTSEIHPPKKVYKKYEAISIYSLLSDFLPFGFKKISCAIFCNILENTNPSLDLHPPLPL